MNECSYMESSRERGGVGRAGRVELSLCAASSQCPHFIAQLPQAPGGPYKRYKQQSMSRYPKVTVSFIKPMKKLPMPMHAIKETDLKNPFSGN